jgi:hypothetical protein
VRGGVRGVRGTRASMLGARGNTRAGAVVSRCNTAYILDLKGLQVQPVVRDHLRRV